ncbi:MAG: hypothetical protein AAF363_01340 [Bacteroidota bacterium]
MQHRVKSNTWKWNFAAGFVPLTAGFVTLITSAISKSNGSSSWNLILNKLDFSYHDIVVVSENSGDFLDLILSVSAVNIITGAFSIIMISRYALKYQNKWAWWYMLVSLIWLGFLDTYSAYVFYAKTGTPLFIMPFAFCILMALGLIKSREIVLYQE